MSPRKFHSIRKKFVIGLAKVTTLTLIIFSSIIIFVNAQSTSSELNEKMDRLLNLSRTSLASAIWQYNNEYVEEYIDSLLLYKDVVYVRVDLELQVIQVKIRDGYETTDFNSDALAAKFIVRSGDVTYNNAKIGRVTIGITKERILLQILYGSLVLISLLFFLNGLIFITVYGLSKKHLFDPLAKLEKSAKDIADGNLDISIDTSGEGEIGRLASTFRQMMATIQAVTASRDELNNEIRARKEFETALKTSQETLLSVLDGIDATVYVADFETFEILFMNKFMINLYGKDLKGERCHQAFRKEIGPCSFCSNNKLIDKDGKPTGVYIWSDMNPVTGKWFMNYDRAIKWIDGRYVRLQIATDITEFKELESELRQAHKMESIGRLAGGIAHDFNNILAAINGFSQLALESLEPDSQAAEDIREVVNSSNRAAKLVKQILSFSRKQSEELTPVPLQEIVHEAVQLLRATLPTTIELKEEIDSDCGPILADSTMLHQVIINLCTNGAHAMEETGGQLEIILNQVAHDQTNTKFQELKSGDYAQLAVRDSGTGIAEKDLEHIFDPYFTTKDVGKGSGMGLAVVHGVIQSHQGAIHVDSNVGHGSTFTIYLPIVQGDGHLEVDDSAKLPTGKESILVVDDEERIVKLTLRRLEKLGYQVTPMTKSHEALSTITENPGKFDLIISDQTMPVITGDQLAGEIRKIRPEMPIIICSGLDSKKDNTNNALTEGLLYLNKPVELVELAHTVRLALDNAKQKTSGTRKSVR